MSTAITRLRNRWGISDADIAEAMGVSRGVLRRGQVSAVLVAEELGRADSLNEFCEAVSMLGYEPATLLSMQLVEGYTATGWDLYAAGKSEALLAYARGEWRAEEMLVDHDPDWRRTYWTSFKTVQAADGRLSVVGKSWDDVRAQMPEASR